MQQLDFSGLNKIALRDFEEAPQIAQESRDASRDSRSTPGSENAATGLETAQSAPPELEREANQRKQTLKTAAEVYKRYQENIKATELLQAKILKGIRAQEDIYSLFLLTAKALSLTVSCREFYTQIRRELPEYYPDAAEAATLEE